MCSSDLRGGHRLPTLLCLSAIFLYFGHRSSVDFDFFSHLPLDEGKDRELRAVLPFLREARLIQKAPDTRSYITGENVKLSFFGGIRLGRMDGIGVGGTSDAAAGPVDDGSV